MKKLLACITLLVFTLSACGQEPIMNAFIGTPHIFIATDGEVTTSINPQDSAEYFESESSFDALLAQNNLVDTNEKSGEVIAITYDEYLDMLDNKESFIVMITQTTCSHCIAFKESILNDYVKEHGVKMYEINLTNEEDPQTVFNTLKAFISE